MHLDGTAVVHHEREVSFTGSYCSHFQRNGHNSYDHVDTCFGRKESVVVEQKGTNFEADNPHEIY